MNLSLKNKQLPVILTTVQQTPLPTHTHILNSVLMVLFLNTNTQQSSSSGGKELLLPVLNRGSDSKLHSLLTPSGPVHPRHLQESTHNHHQRLYKHANTLILSRNALIHKHTYHWLLAKAGPGHNVSVCCETGAFALLKL